MIRLIYMLCFLLFTTSINASDLKIENVRLVNRQDVQNTPLSVIFDISWKNAWRNEKNHDAIWVFMKFSGQWDNHVKLNPTGHQIIKSRHNAKGKIEVSNDSLGFYLSPKDGYRGDLSFKLQIQIDTSNQEISWGRLNGFSVYGLEMVYIPEGAYTLGSPDEASISRASFYKSNDEGNRKALYKLDSEAEIMVSPSDGDLYYWSEEALYNGDQKGPIPKAFPKGYNAFYVMKYELTQGQYVDFLNKLPDNWTYLRSPIGGRDYYKKRGCIRFKKGKYFAENPNRPMNYISFTDGLAYTDWAALRPITELEYEKAARGPEVPKDAEFVWGTNNYDNLERYVQNNEDLIFQNGVDEALLNDNNRDVYGASFYWVMDLSGSVWEKVITVGNPIGRQFEGTHGDGKLEFGHATNTDWPDSDDETGGFGYRGGGYYSMKTNYSDFNPHSPIGYRYYGAWSGGPRYVAYGYRAGRTAD